MLLADYKKINLIIFMKTQEETITISKRVYENLLTNKKELEILYEHGVQSWELYEQSMEILDNDLENK